MIGQAYQNHAEQVLRTVSKEVQEAQNGWRWACVAAAIFSVCLGLLTFSVLATFLVPVVAILVALTIHVVGIIAAHHALHHSSRLRWLWTIAAIAASVVAYVLAWKRAVMWFEGSVFLAGCMALIEPLGIWVLGGLTARAHEILENARDYQRRARELQNAISTNHRPARSWSTKVQQVRDELRDITRSAAETDAEVARRDARAAHVARFLKMLETHASVEHADADDAQAEGVHASAADGPWLGLSRESVPAEAPDAGMEQPNTLIRTGGE